MTDLADLGDLDFTVTHKQGCADPQAVQIDAVDHQVLPEIPGLQVEATIAHLVDVGRRQQTHLTMPIPRMSITIDAVVDHQFGHLHRCLPVAFLAACAHRHHPSGVDHGRHRSVPGVPVGTVITGPSTTLFQQPNAFQHH